MKERVAARYRACRKDGRFLRAFVFSLLTFGVSLVLTYFAVTYAALRASNSVTDLVLSNVPVVDVDGLFIYGALVLVVFVIVLVLTHPGRLPFTLYALSLFYSIRAGFITLTHLAPFPVQAPVEISSGITLFLSWFFSAHGDDLFFSAHTGAPFLLALIFWKDRLLRYIFIAWSVFFAIIVLLGHIHYSIDVASAYFITYTIFVIATRLCSGEWHRFNFNHHE